jgi:chromosome segregation ATPase
MAAEPAPPGPPDGRFDALEDRVASLEEYRDHVAPYSFAAVNFGVSVLHREVRQLSDTVTRHGQKLDQMDATLRDVVAVQADQARALEGLGRVMERHSRMLQSQGERLDSQGQLLQSQGERLDSQGQLLQSQGERLDGLDQRLDSQGRKLDQHGELLQEILRRLPPAPAH